MSDSIAERPLDQDLPPEAQLYEAGQIALDLARELGASGAAVSLGSSVGLTTQVRNQTLESVEFQRDNDLGITVYFGHRRGHANTGDLRAESIREIVEAACIIARQTQDDPAAGLPEAERMATQTGDLDLDHPIALSVAQSHELALACEDAALTFDPRISNSEGASVNTHRSRDVLMNSLGFRGARTRSDYSLSVAVIARNDEDMQRDYWYRRSLDASALDAVQEVGHTAAERAVTRLSPRKLSTRRAPVLFPPNLARGLIGHMLGAISGSAVYRRASFLLDHLGQPLFPAGVQMIQRPHQPGRFGANWFDAEGVATREMPLIEDGRLCTWLLGSYSARKLGLTTTGNAGGVHALDVSPTRDADVAALMAEAGTGLLVTELMGQGVNANTGDYSRGAAGIWFENGQPAYPVAEITIAGNLIDLYRDLVAIGSDIDMDSTVRCGSILLSEMTIAGS